MSQVEGENVPLSALIEADNLPRLLVMSFGVWLYAADSTLVATLMPVAVEDIGGLPFLSWTYALYQLGSVVTGAIAGLVVIDFSEADGTHSDVNDERKYSCLK